MATDTADRTPADGYDVIGDVHGQAGKLAALLQAMGYSDEFGAWRHPSRRAVFVGDLIDNGPQQLATVALVRAMVAAGSALVTMGNHEFNAIAWHRGLRERSEKNKGQHEAFLAEVADGSPLHDEIIAWFANLPLWLELDGLRVIHACWDERSMAALMSAIEPDGSLHADGFTRAATRGTPEFDAVEILLKGPEVPLPDRLGYLDKKGNRRSHARFEWWGDAPATYAQRAHLPSGTLDFDGRPHPGFPDTDLPLPLPVTPYDGPPVIYGHYWETGPLKVTSERSACVDYSAGKGGPLVAYRWSGERTLTNDHMVSVP
ncbi:MAG: metallophosphoesterase [Ilumatobacteraceae bacterium]